MNNPNIPEFLKKIASKENARAAAALCLDLFLNDGISKEEKKARLSAFLKTNAEHLDDGVSLIPGIGPVLAALVDSPAVDDAEARLIDMVAELTVQAVKGSHS